MARKIVVGLGMSDGLPKQSVSLYASIHTGSPLWTSDRGATASRKGITR